MVGYTESDNVRQTWCFKDTGFLFTMWYIC